MVASLDLSDEGLVKAGVASRTDEVRKRKAIRRFLEENGLLQALVEYIRANAGQLNVDADRLGLWACSSNNPMALSFLMQNGKARARFAVLYYGWMLTPDNRFREDINGQGAERGFYAEELSDVAEMRTDVPLFIVRAGLDNIPNLNDSIDHFVSVATDQGMPVTFVERIASGANPLRAGIDSARPGLHRADDVACSASSSCSDDFIVCRTLRLWAWDSEPRKSAPA